MESMDLLAAYIELVVSSAPTALRISGKKNLTATEIGACQDWVRGLAQTPEFLKLVTCQDSDFDRLCREHGLIPEHQERLQTLLRRSGFYLDVYAGTARTPNCWCRNTKECSPAARSAFFVVNWPHYPQFGFPARASSCHTSTFDSSRSPNWTRF